jgi:hypothetical protein
LSVTQDEKEEEEEDNEEEDEEKEDDGEDEEDDDDDVEELRNAKVLWRAISSRPHHLHGVVHGAELFGVRKELVGIGRQLWGRVGVVGAIQAASCGSFGLLLGGAGQRLNAASASLSIGPS